MKSTFKLEINLFLLVLKLRVLFNGDMKKVEQFLYDTLKHTSNKPSFIGEWLQNRFIKIQMSKETQVVLMRRAGYSYTIVGKVTGKSPNTIKTLIDNYDISYNIDADTDRELEYMFIKWTEAADELEEMGLSVI